MNFNFRKIGSVIASAVMLGSTIGLAAANFPAPFVKNGAADVAVVWGSSAATTDLAAVADITTSLQAELAKQTAQSGGSTSGSSSVTGGDFVKLETANDKFDLSELASRFYSTLDEEELSTVLANGVYLNDANNEFDYDQKIVLGNLNLSHFQNSDLGDAPAIGFELVSDNHILNYSLEFSPDAAEGGTAFADLETTDLTMLGRTYYIVDATSTSNGVKLTLLDSANSVFVTKGTATSVTAGDKTYNVEMTYIDSNNVILKVDGVTTNKLGEGDVFKVAEDTYVAVKSNLYAAKEADVSQAEISIGSGKIVMENGQEVKVNNEVVSDIAKNNDATLTAYITNSSTDIDKIVLSWDLGSDTFLTADGDAILLPGFETIKLSMGGFNVPAKEVTSLSNKGDDSYELSTYVKDGKVSIDVLYLNSSKTGIEGIGKDSNELLVTSSTSELIFNRTTGSYFVASWISGDESESYVFDVTEITDTTPAKNTTTIKSVASGSTVGKSIDIGETAEFDKIKLTLNAADDGGSTVNLTISTNSGTVSFNKLYTKEGMKIQLPYNSATVAADGKINLTAVPTSFVMNFTEEDEDGNINVGNSFAATLGFTGGTDSKSSVTAVSTNDFETDDNSDDFEGYVPSALATRTLFKTGGDQDTLDVEYHGSESFADVYVSEAGAIVSSANGTVVTGTTGTVKELGSVSVNDAQVGSVSGKNLIVVGGSCVNSVASQLLDGAGCGDSFTAKTTVTSNQFLIQTFARTDGKVATLVAGYNAVDTTNAAKFLTTQPVDTTAGKKYVGTSATSASLQVV